MKSTAQIFIDGHPQSRDHLILQAKRAARGLAQLGVDQGDRVALLLRNDFAFLEAQQAAAELGAYSVPLNWHGRPPEIEYVLNDAKPKVLIAHADLLQPLRSLLPKGLIVFVVPTPTAIRERYRLKAQDCEPQSQDTDWASWLSQFPPLTQSQVGRPRATVIYTSGTTGHPKAVVRDPATPEQAKAYTEIIARVYGLVPGVRALVTGPLYHASPNAYIRQAFQVADTVVIQSKFDPEETLALIEKHQITNAVMVPTMFVRILQLSHEIRDRYDIRSLTWVTHTGAPCPVETKKALMDWWGPIIYETYGGSEVGTATLATPEDWLAHPGSVGVPTPGTQIAFYNENGQRVSDGEIGEIYMRVPAYADFTYMNAPEKRQSVERDGLISCGDVGYLQDGRLYLCDRRSDMVISGGVNIYPAEIEKVLTLCPGIQDCAVFGVPDAEFGESLLAVIQPLPDQAVTEAQARQFLSERLASFKVPKQFVFSQELPREDSGKVFKRRLRDPYWVNAGRQI